ncbi:hypothetical protein CYLTODRAFT_351518 [Cylindrobasidium torrendii FP15055 ss-10]|uniref:Uncharacterized protein n=1 Tax=Cylindrobasidium torrendii FP15055 ss-10 TaxID=1314674 RepID=A0A0D7BDS1_9AGAR|nr:hypothetical protein CYLTODRAFT_351518 [Cylindrobasidium torrendii FP15055 ss-10]
MANLTSISCGQDTLLDLATCLNGFTVPKAAYTEQTYFDAQPTEIEFGGWTQLVTSMLEGRCAIPDALEPFYNVAELVDNGQSYCVASERYTADAGYYAKGWGLFIVPLNTSESRHFHLSSPHPMFDFYEPDQAITLFQRSKARSLLISGRHRQALSLPTTCVPSTEVTTYWTTDPAHSVAEPFHAANVAIQAWQDAHGGCPLNQCAYIQLHGKASTTCSPIHFMISSGLGPADASWYTNTSLNLPASRLRTELQKSFPAYNVSLPSDTSCSLTATKNVFGRFLNGVHPSDLCTQAADVQSATGRFVHVEQAFEVTQADHYDGWVRALEAAFPL